MVEAVGVNRESESCMADKIEDEVENEREREREVLLADSYLQYTVLS